MKRAVWFQEIITWLADLLKIDMIMCVCVDEGVFDTTIVDEHCDAYSENLLNRAFYSLKQFFDEKGSSEWIY